ncbi:MAG TPA: UvrD-helicase domain-containing protein [Myxococcaceae bacterium]|nr:UvrD-helicase domain-containing protein [Myxococcaceae bacterium]
MPSPVSSPDELLADLNPPQREAVTAGEGPLLVLAGAGSGKTRVITRRVAHLVLARRVPAWRILAVTFTNKAAREMRERLFALLGPWASDLLVSTFHAAAATILRREAEKVGLTRSFVIYDEADQLTLVKRAMREERIDPVINPREVLHRIDMEKNAGRLPEVDRVDPNDYRGLAVQRAYRAYQRLLRAANAVDFGDLLLLLVQLLRQDEAVRAHYAGRFQHVLVDEFQDTNAVQMALLQQLAPPPAANLVVVGDDDQSIYRWRGADVGNILRFPEEYTGAAIVKLEQNYRSDQIILDAANAVIAKNEHRMPKRLWTERQRGDPLGLLVSRDERDEAHEIARRIHVLVREGRCAYAGIAVFFRVNAQSRVLEEAFRLSRVPYTLVSGRSFYERAEVKDAASYLRLMVNPRSDADLLRIINTPARAIGDTTQERLAAWAADHEVSLFEALAEVERIGPLNAAAQKRLGAFRALLDTLVSLGGEAPSAAWAVERMLEETKLVDALLAEGSVESETRAENLRELLGAAQEFDLERAARPPPSAEQLAAEVPPLQAFLEQISLVGEADGEAGEGRVSLMTLHAAKGLEFDAVFMPGMEDGVFPHNRALEDFGDAEQMSEERRLCYVGFTRARRKLTVSLAQARSLFGELRFNPPSRFLRDVPPELFDIQLRAPAAPAAGMPGGLSARRRPYDDDGPRIDRSYAQAPDAGWDGESVVGLRVRHAQFGEGEVVACDGSGANAKLTVAFPRVGLKRIIARFLQPA